MTDYDCTCSMLGDDSWACRLHGDGISPDLRPYTIPLRFMVGMPGPEPLVVCYSEAMSDDDYPKTYRHPVTEQERPATTKAQEVALKFDGYRLVEAETQGEAGVDPETPPLDTEKADAPPADAKPETPVPAPKTAAPKPGPTTKAQEGK